jgi:hypothetical protein
LTTGTLPVARGGTGSATQNFVDLTTAQTVAGTKTFSSQPKSSAGGSAGTGSQGLASEAYVQSRGMNLLANGTGLLLNNYNFSFGTFTGADAYNCSGSFFDATLSTTRTTDELMPVDPGKTYEGRLYARTNTTSAISHAYFGGAFYDVDKNSVLPNHTMFVANTLTTLAADLKPGDTTVQLTSGTNWGDGTNGVNTRQMIFWNYVNSLGYAWPALTYSRNQTAVMASTPYSVNGFWAAGGVSGNVVTLTAAWPVAYGTIPAGTQVSQGNSGGTYKYFMAANVNVPSTYTLYRGTIGGLDLTGTNATTSFPPGAAYMKMLFLLNRDTVGGVASTTYLSNLWCSEITAANLGPQAQNSVLAGPTSGTAAPSFRALVAADIPNLDTGKLTTGILPVARGGTGNATGQPSGTAGGDLTGSYPSPTLVAARDVTGIPAGTVVPIAGNEMVAIAVDAKGRVTSLDTMQIQIGPDEISTTLTTAVGGTGVTTASANAVFAGPSGGAAAAPSFRALVAADIPNLDTSKLTTGTLPVARGGTGNTTGQPSGTAGGDLAGTYPSPTLVVQAGVTPGVYGTPDAGIGHVVQVDDKGRITSIDEAPIQIDAAGVTSGTLPVARGGTGAATASANLIFAGPGSGAAAAPSFRALVAADIPNLDTSKLTTGTLAVARGGTGAATASANLVFAGPGSGAAAAPSFRSLVAADIPNLDTSKLTTGTLPVARGGTGLSAGGTAGQVLTMVSGAPAWATPAGGGGFPTYSAASDTAAWNAVGGYVPNASMTLAAGTWLVIVTADFDPNDDPNTPSQWMGIAHGTTPTWAFGGNPFTGTGGRGTFTSPPSSYTDEPGYLYHASCLVTLTGSETVGLYYISSSNNAPIFYDRNIVAIKLA